MQEKGVLIYFAVMAISVLAAGEDVEITGHYKVNTPPKQTTFDDYLRVMGYSDEKRVAIRDSQSSIFKLSKNDTSSSWRIDYLSKKGPTTMLFASGKEFSGPLNDGRFRPSTFTVDESKKTLHRVIRMDGFDATQEFIFSAKGFNVTFRAKEVACIREYVRVAEADVEKFLQSQ